MIVFVIAKSGKPLMPTNPAKARHLLKKGRAKVYQLEPFTIQLSIDCPEIVQPVIVGMDTGARVVGLAAKSQTRILYQAEVYLREDIAGLIKQRAMYRRNRRWRKVRYRRNKWFDCKLKCLTSDNREGKKTTKKQLKEKAEQLREALKRAGRYNCGERKKGWLPPSLLSILHWHIESLKKLGKILPISQVRVEIAPFDLQKLNNPLHKWL